MAARFFRSQSEWRRWLAANHARESELVIGFYKKDSGRGGLTYAQALDEALCFGWIDALVRGRDAESYTIRFTPRKKRSTWSQVNLRHMKRLLAEDRVRPPGLAAYEQRDETRTKRYSFENESPEFTPAETKRFRANRKAWQFFQALPPKQRGGFTWWVASAKKDDTRRRRLDALIATCTRGVVDPMRLPRTR